MKATEHPRVSKAPAKARAAAKPPARSTPHSRDRDVARDAKLEHKPDAQTTRALSDEERSQRIAVAAYLRAEKRGFAPGLELDDWLAAESEVDGAPLLAHQLAHSDT